MPRKGPAPKRPVIADPVYGSPLVSQLVSKILLNGKKTVAQNIVYTAMEGTRTKTGIDPVHSRAELHTARRPTLEVKSAASAVRRTRFLWKSSLPAPPRWRCAGWSASHGSVARRPWPSG